MCGDPTFEIMLFTPFTSLSGVRQEVRRSLPLQIAGLVVALGMWIVGGLDVESSWMGEIP